MHQFREFDAGPDPFGRKYHVLFKWLQTAISLRHADTVDVKFVLTDDSGELTQKTIALPHGDLLSVGKELGRNVDDAWCARIAARHLLQMIVTGDDLEKDLVTLTRVELKTNGEAIVREEREASRAA